MAISTASAEKLSSSIVPARAVLDVRVVDQELGGRHNFRDARLVVGAEQRGAVGRDDVVADHILQDRMVGHADDLGRIAMQPDVAALVVPHDLRLHVRAGEIGRRIHVRAEADDRNVVLVGVR
ncbi:MAG: hypothetical protein K0R61_1230 [Microvirga sp.]|nr:hypothetical protein [Microvirga sp.]